mmetsp:Transcript_12410/g.30110  ORF Transcript_12410/g.30110 Transcript_12410/m.30110 type:complete len:224 (-) Transcript_12410:399-1070(-)
MRQNGDSGVAAVVHRERVRLFVALPDVVFHAAHALLSFSTRRRIRFSFDPLTVVRALAVTVAVAHRSAEAAVRCPTVHGHFDAVYRVVRVARNFIQVHSKRDFVVEEVVALVLAAFVIVADVGSRVAHGDLISLGREQSFSATAAPVGLRHQRGVLLLAATCCTVLHREWKVVPFAVFAAGLHSEVQSLFPLPTLELEELRRRGGRDGCLFSPLLLRGGSANL